MFICISYQALLDTVVKKSEGYSVEQLERLYSLLSQCIYQHRREYDKTQLLEVRHAHILGEPVQSVSNCCHQGYIKMMRYHNITFYNEILQIVICCEPRVESQLTDRLKMKL